MAFLQRRFASLFALLLVLVLLGPLSTQSVRAQDAAEPTYAIQLIYAVPKDGIDRNLDNNGTILNIVQSAQEWLKEQTDGRILNLAGGEHNPSIEFLELSRTEAELLALPDEEISYQVEYEARAAGFNQPGMINAIFFEGTEPDGQTCGAAPSPESTPANSATLFLQSDCQDFPFAGPGDEAGFWELTFMHEIFHALGAVPDCAPNNDDGHVDDRHDLMYGGDQDWSYPVQLDVDHDDYYDTGRTACYDTARSPYLIPNIANTEPFPAAFQDMPLESCALAPDPPTSDRTDSEVWMVNLSSAPVDIIWRGNGDDELVDTLDPWSGVIYTSVPGDAFFFYAEDGACLGSFLFPDFIDIGVVWIVQDGNASDALKVDKVDVEMQWNGTAKI